MTPRGRKIDLINQVVNKKIHVENLPQIYSLTEKGLKIIEEYDHVIQGHKEKYIDVTEILKYKEKRPGLISYKDLKWGYLNEQEKSFTKELKFGLVRNNYMYKANQFSAESRYNDSLMNYIIVVLFDASGLGNDYEYRRSPNYSNIFMADGILRRIKEIINNGDISEKEYNEAFERAVKIIKYPLSLSFLNNKDLHVLKNKILKLNSVEIEEYLKKYE